MLKKVYGSESKKPNEQGGKKMPTVEDVVLEFFAESRKKNTKCPLMLWKMSGTTATPLYKCVADLTGNPTVLDNRYKGGFPTLSVLLHRTNFKVRGSRFGMELLSVPQQEQGYLFAVCGYPPTCADFGMAYRTGLRYVLQPLSRTTYACWRISGNGSPQDRKELTILAPEDGRTILNASGNNGGTKKIMKAEHLYDFDWFNKFLAPLKHQNTSHIRVSKFYKEELSAGIIAKIGNADGQWHSHRGVSHDSDLWWTIVALYTSFTWGFQLPTYRGTKDYNVPDKAAGMFLDGFNVSALLLDTDLKPCAWGLNTNKINKSLHAETALVLAWLKEGNQKKEDYEDYTFISPWRSCCMCSAWISDVYRGCDVVWFIDDPGLPVRHLDHMENETADKFLPTELEKAGRPMCKKVLRYYPWFKEIGKITHWDYNRHYLRDLKAYLRKSNADNPQGAQIEDKYINDKSGPVELFQSASYFEELAKAWDASRFIHNPVLEYLHNQGQLKSYVNNILALRRCILAFDT